MSAINDAYSLIIRIRWSTLRPFVERWFAEVRNWNSERLRPVLGDLHRVLVSP